MFVKTSKCKSNNMAITYLHFNKAHYKTDMFKSNNIVMPDTVVKSVPERQAEFLAGRVCSKQSLYSKYNIIEQVHIGSYREPVWPEGVFGSITHSNDIAASIVSNQFSIGIDIENIINKKESAEIKEFIATDKEIDVFKESMISDHAVSVIFSLKESIYKCLYPHVKAFFDFKDATVTCLNLVNKESDFLTYELTAFINKDLSNDIMRNHQLRCVFTVVSDKLVSLCVQDFNFNRKVRSELISASEILANFR